LGALLRRVRARAGLRQEKPEIVDRPSPVQVLLDDPEGNLRVTRQLDASAMSR
jgi:hypothetical protein